MVMQQRCAGEMGRYTQVGADRIYSEVIGSGPPLILIHGLGGSRRWWQRNRAALAHRHEVHIVDLAGCGRSSGRLTLACAAEQLAEWMQRADLVRASLLGHSMGGFIAAHLAASHPQLIDRLVLVSAVLNTPSLRGQRHTPNRLPIPLSMFPIAMEDAVRTGLPNMARIAYELLRTDIGPTLAAIQAKTLLVWGEHDSAVPLIVARAAARLLSMASIAVICDAGHAPMWEQPRAFNQTVLSFLAGSPIDEVITY